MPFKSKAQQSYLFAKLPRVAKRFAEHTPKGAYKDLPEHVGDTKKKAEVTPEQLEQKGPTKVESLKLLGPNDPPTQRVEVIGPTAESNPVAQKQAQFYCCLSLASMAKTACTTRDLPQVRAVTKLAESYAATRDLAEAIRRCYPAAPAEKRAALQRLIIERALAIRKTAGWGASIGGWLDDTVGGAWDAVKNTASDAWQGTVNAVDKHIGTPIANAWKNNVTDPIANANKAVNDWTQNNITKPIGNAYKAVDQNVFQPVRNVAGAISGAYNGMQQGYNQAAQAGAAKYAPPTTPAPAAGSTAFHNSLKGGAPGLKTASRQPSIAVMADRLEKRSTSASVPMTQPVVEQPQPTPEAAPQQPAKGPKRQVRYSFNRAPAKKRTAKQAALPVTLPESETRKIPVQARTAARDTVAGAGPVNGQPVKVPGGIRSPLQGPMQALFRQVSKTTRR